MSDHEIEIDSVTYHYELAVVGCTKDEVFVACSECADRFVCDMENALWDD